MIQSKLWIKLKSIDWSDLCIEYEPFIKKFSYGPHSFIRTSFILDTYVMSACIYLYVFIIM